MHCATRNLSQKCRAPVDGGHRDRRVHRTLVAAAGLADQMQSANRARDRRGIPDRGFEQHVGGARVDLGGACAHHAADRRDGDVVHDQHITGFQRALDAVEGDHLLPRFGEPDRELAMNLGAVMGVHGVA